MLPFLETVPSFASFQGFLGFQAETVLSEDLWEKSPYLGDKPPEGSRPWTYRYKKGVNI